MPAKIEIHRHLIDKNLNSIFALHPQKKIWIVCKANSYGLGTPYIQGVLSLQNRYPIEGLAVATFKEAKQLVQFNVPILVMSGYFGSLLTRENAKFCNKYDIIPVIHSQEDLRSPLPDKFYIKVNIGMNRLGIPFGYAKKLNGEFYGVMTHFAESHLNAHKETLRQRNSFYELCDQLNAKHYSASNSDAIANQLVDHRETHIRPGISLYLGLDGNQPCFSWSAEVIATRDLLPGETLGYGFSYTAHQPQKIAILGAGYADGIPRSLSNTSFFWLNRSKTNILGTVCMDLTAVDISHVNIKRGERVTLIRGDHPIKNFLHHSERISYEILTGLSDRNERELI